MKTKLAVTAAIIEHQGKILCARKAVGKPLAGYWEFPGGKIEANETPEQCLARELTEELGIYCKVKTHYFTSEYDQGERIIELAAYCCEWKSGQIQLTDHDKIVWLEAAHLKQLNWAPADIPIVDKLISDAKNKA